MTWKNDGHGLLFRSEEIKLYKPSHTWAMKLSQLDRQNGIVRIMTYSLPSLNYVREQLGRRPLDIYITCHSKFVEQAQAIKQEFPEIAIAVSDTMHSKVLLIEPATLYVGSANFGASGSHETMIGVRSKEAHDDFVRRVFIPAWQVSQEIM